MRNMTVAAAALVVGAAALGTLVAADSKPASAQSAFQISDKVTPVDRGRSGIWEPICADGQSQENSQAVGLDLLAQGQCHLRFVDIFPVSGPTDGNQGVGMIAAFVVPGKKGVRVEFAISQGLAFNKDGFHLSRNGFTVWRLKRDDCLSDGVCTFSGPAAGALLKAFSDPVADTLEMQMEFTDQSGRQHNRQWEMMPFSGVLAEFVPAHNPAMM